MSVERRNGVLIIAGPTACGKTELALALARRFDAEIVGADSRQIYRNMPLGTAAPSAQEQSQIPHHLVQFLAPHERYSAARYAEEAMRAIDAIHARGRRAIVAGGTGFYLRALAGDVKLSAAYDPAVRARLAAEARVHPPEVLFEWLRALAPERARTISAHDRYRVVRALEVALAAPVAREREVPTLRGGGVPFLKACVAIGMAELLPRIERRVDAMLHAGFVAEAERVGERAVAATAVGYPDALAYVRGWSTAGELREHLIRATRRYAKRQMTWFRSEPNVRFIAFDGAASVLENAARELPGWA